MKRYNKKYNTVKTDTIVMEGENRKATSAMEGCNGQAWTPELEAMLIPAADQTVIPVETVDEEETRIEIFMRELEATIPDQDFDPDVEDMEAAEFDEPLDLDELAELEDAA